MIDPSGKGLTGTYRDMIKEVFQNKYWQAGQVGGFNLMERNFSFFFGIAVGLWESTLVSDNAPFDIWNEAGRPSEGVPGFGAREMAGLDVFQNQGKCINCHLTPAFFGASIINPEIQVNPNNGEVQGVVERMIMGDGEPALYDLGFYNIGVRPTEEDLGRGPYRSSWESAFLF